MNNRKALKKEHLIIWGVLFFTGIALWLFAASAKTTSPSEMYQYGMLEIIAGVCMLASVVVLLLSSISSRNTQKKNVRNCPKCGMVVPSKGDRFCRGCGASLLTSIQ